MKFKKEEVSKKVGSKIRELRLSKGLTIERVAFDSGMEYTQLSRIELGKINTSIYQVYKISDSLSVPVPEIFHVLNKKTNGSGL
jgi:transcriptional regulator with XRE-family HTH domain